MLLRLEQVSLRYRQRGQDTEAVRANYRRAMELELGFFAARRLKKLLPWARP
jgi:hypothetical protein